MSLVSADCAHSNCQFVLSNQFSATDVAVSKDGLPLFPLISEKGCIAMIITTGNRVPEDGTPCVFTPRFHTSSPAAIRPARSESPDSSAFTNIASRPASLTRICRAVKPFFFPLPVCFSRYRLILAAAVWSLSRYTLKFNTTNPPQILTSRLPQNPMTGSVVPATPTNPAPPTPPPSPCLPSE